MDRIDELMEKGIHRLPENERAELFALMDANLEHGEPREHRNGASASDADIANVARTAPATSKRSAEDDAFSRYLRYGLEGIIGNSGGLRMNAVTQESRAMGEDTSGQGGGFLVPQGFWDRLAIALKAYGGLSSQFAQLQTPDGTIMPFPTNNPTTTEASYLSENSQVSATTVTFGQGMLFAWTLPILIQASRQLVQDSATDVDAFVADRIGEAIGRKMAAEAISGLGPASKAATGINVALGDFGTASTGTGGYYALSAGTTVKTFSNPSSGGTELGNNVLAPATVFDMITAVDPAYYNPGDGSSAAWYMNAVQAFGMRQLVDSNDRPLVNLDSGLSDGSVGLLGGFPVYIVNDIPNLTEDTTGGPIFGNMQHAMVARTVSTPGIQVLTERYADYLQIGYLGWQRFDYQPVDLRAAVVTQANAT